jgi:hypothetical protein
LTLFDSLFGARNRYTSIEAVITDVTRMQGDKVCIAALHRDKSIRLHDPAPREQWLRLMGGLSPGDAVTLTWRPARRRRRPHLEDGDWNPDLFTKVDRLREDEFIKRLSAIAFSSIKDTFGKPCFYSENGNAAFTPGKGSRSLASVTATSVRVYPFGDGVRVDFADSRREWTMAPMEDLIVRNHQSQCSSCSCNLRSLLASEFEGTQAVLRVGLSRPFENEDYEAACYLQVNHVFLTPPRQGHFV